MAFQYRRDSKPSSDNASGLNRAPSEYTETQPDVNNRDSLPKYYPRDHEVTRWLVNQMRCRNGLHHLVNLANVQPSLLSAYFELYDQPHLYIDARTGPGMPAYGIKTVLYLTPLAIAIYFRLRSVLRLLLDTSGTRIHARARQEIDVNATCYVRRVKPRPGPFVMDEYSTTHPAIIAVRREFFVGLTILMSANFHPQAPIGIIERLGTARETTHWFVDLLDFCVKLLNTRPGVDVIGLLQTISYRTLTDNNTSSCYYDPCVYDVRPIAPEPGKPDSDEEIWCSVFHRLARKGASRSYSNCGNRLIGLLEHVAAAGFFRQKYMPKGPVQYDAELVSRKGNRMVGARKMTPEQITKLTGPEKDTARVCIAADRDACLCLLTLWLERVRNRCLDRQAQRLFRLLTTGLADTGLLHDFLFPPPDVDPSNISHPYWLSMGLAKNANKQLTSQSMLPVDFLDDDANEICELEPPQVNEIRQEVGILGHALGIVDYSEKLYNLGYPRLVEIMPVSGAVGDAENYVQDRSGLQSGGEIYKDAVASPSQLESPDNFCNSEDLDRKGNCSRSSAYGSAILTQIQRRSRASNSRPQWSSPTRNMSTSPNSSGKLGISNQISLEDRNDNMREGAVVVCGKPNIGLSEPEPVSLDLTSEKKMEPLSEKGLETRITNSKVATKKEVTRSTDRGTNRNNAWRYKRNEKRSSKLTA
ncbi:hypothetical protein FGIG_09658 [Fasciola gigantica]|uniref:Uncharacterized protein n=1 Tax=Fasciola gigantica TaxID=46835 RepID=A0A504YKX7_FASGI|nr:hypothetical protein FGIG_09658 [Fasciola gigantica]